MSVLSHWPVYLIILGFAGLVYAWYLHKHPAGGHRAPRRDDSECQGHCLPSQHCGVCHGAPAAPGEDAIAETIAGARAGGFLSAETISIKPVHGTPPWAPAGAFPAEELVPLPGDGGDFCTGCWNDNEHCGGAIEDCRCPCTFPGEVVDGWRPARAEELIVFTHETLTYTDEDVAALKARFLAAKDGPVRVLPWDGAETRAVVVEPGWVYEAEEDGQDWAETTFPGLLDGLTSYAYPGGFPPRRDMPERYDLLFGTQPWPAEPAASAAELDAFRFELETAGLDADGVYELMGGDS